MIFKKNVYVLFIFFIFISCAEDNNILDVETNENNIEMNIDDVKKQISDLTSFPIVIDENEIPDYLLLDTDNKLVKMYNSGDDEREELYKKIPVYFKHKTEQVNNFIDKILLDDERIDFSDINFDMLSSELKKRGLK